MTLPTPYELVQKLEVASIMGGEKGFYDQRVTFRWPGDKQASYMLLEDLNPSGTLTSFRWRLGPDLWERERAYEWRRQRRIITKALVMVAYPQWEPRREYWWLSDHYTPISRACPETAT